MPRILTYNVHRCLGGDRRLDVGRVAEVIAAAGAGHRRPAGGRCRPRPDRRGRPGARHRPAAGHGLPLQRRAEGRGGAVRRRHPDRPARAAGQGRAPARLRRGSCSSSRAARSGWRSRSDGTEVQVINTHLGLVPREQQRQAAALAGPDWLGHADRAATGHPARRLQRHGRLHRLSHAGGEARRRAAAGRAPKRRNATFPSAFPLLRIDHVFVTARRARARDPRALRASDASGLRPPAAGDGLRALARRRRPAPQLRSPAPRP